MPVFSMTGFARRDGGGEGYRWTWELRSVNGKGLDIRLRLPPGFEYIEIAARERLSAGLARGNVQATLTTHQQPAAGRIRINEDVLAEVTAAMEKIAGRLQVATADARWHPVRPRGHGDRGRGAGRGGARAAGGTDPG